MKKEKKTKRRRKASSALMWRITAIVMAMWLFAMVYLTLVVAQDRYDSYVEDIQVFSRAMGKAGNWYHYDQETGEYTGGLHYSRMIRNAYGSWTSDPGIELPFYYEKWISSMAQQAVVIFDKDNQPFIGREGYAYVDYRSGRDWFEEGPITGDASINMNATECGKAVLEQMLNGDSFAWFDTFRLTGYFEGDEFVLADAGWSKYEFDQRETLNEWRHQHEYENICNIKDWDSFMDWNDLYDGAVPTDQELVDIYVYYDDIYVNDSGSEVTVQGEKWKLEELAQAFVSNDILSVFIGFDSSQMLLGIATEEISEQVVREEVQKYAKDGLWETVMVDTGYYYDDQGNMCAYAGVFRFQPIREAAMLLADLYVLSLLPLILMLFLIRWRIREDLTHPIQHFMKFAKKDYAVLPDTVESDWQEIYDLEQGYVKIQKDIHEYRKEITQLNTALDYAHNAEENRRRMVSNITHELKTPLAVIHSYAEGLKEGIAADRQEHYLDVILEEAHRMDGMVLEMLDLSRLEAGKVRLASDRFSLLELTQRVVDKLSLLIEEKELKVEYVWAHDCEITADEGRIGQAVTNLVSNAIKYSPRGGSVYVGVTRVKEKTMFSIENQSEPLPEEVLEKLWDSFYRADASRTEKGTGLGLPITKAIVELHGGSCQVKNTATGVEFKFYLP